MKITQKEAVQILLQHLQKFGEVLPHDENWIHENAKYRFYPKDTCIHREGDSAQQIFYICSGMLARARFEENPKNQSIKRKIISVGLPQMALLTTEHLYTDTPNVGDILTLRPSHILTIPYHKMKAIKAHHQLFNALMAALSNKKKRQLSKLRRINLIKDPVSIYTEFVNLFPDLNQLLQQEEKQDLLQISRSTINRANYMLLTGRDKRKDCIP